MFKYSLLVVTVVTVLAVVALIVWSAESNSNPSLKFTDQSPFKPTDFADIFDSKIGLVNDTDKINDINNQLDINWGWPSNNISSSEIMNTTSHNPLSFPTRRNIFINAVSSVSPIELNNPVTPIHRDSPTTPANPVSPTDPVEPAKTNSPDKTDKTNTTVTTDGGSNQTTPNLLDTQNMDKTIGFLIKGASEGDKSGYSVSNAGDVNKDGFDDIIIGAPWADPNGKDNAGATYVVYGSPNTIDTNLTDIDTRAFVIKGNFKNGKSGHSVADAGDINNDGFSDLIIGEPGFYRSQGITKGMAYVLLTKTTETNQFKTADVNLSHTADNTNFIIRALAPNDPSRLIGYSVSGAGNVNGDKYVDVIIGAPNFDLKNIAYKKTSISYVIFGNDTTDTVSHQLSTLTSSKRGLGLKNSKGGKQNGRTVSSAGDVNNDGFDDVIIGTTLSAYVIYGGKEKTGVKDLDKDKDRPPGFKITSSAKIQSVSGAGDVNNDGFDDVIIGTPKANFSAGASYVVYGSKQGSDINLSRLSNYIPTDISKGFVIKGANSFDKSGWSVSAAGDINNDNIDDVIIGAPYANTDNGAAGASYVVYGRKKERGAVDLSSFTNTNNDGFIIMGYTNKEKSGWSVSGAGDVNKDGCDDVIIGAPHAAPDNKIDAGVSYVIYGQTKNPGPISFNNPHANSGCSIGE